MQQKKWTKIEIKFIFMYFDSECNIHFFSYGYWGVFSHWVERCEKINKKSV